LDIQEDDEEAGKHTYVHKPGYSNVLGEDFPYVPGLTLQEVWETRVLGHVLVGSRREPLVAERYGLGGFELGAFNDADEDEPPYPRCELVVLRSKHFLPDQSVFAVYDSVVPGQVSTETYMIGPDRPLRKPRKYRRALSPICVRL